MKKFLLSLAALGLIAAAPAVSHAAAIDGSVGFTSSSITLSGSTDLNGAVTTIDLDTNSTNDPGTSTGDYTAYPETAIDDTSLDLSDLGSFSFGSADFGTFTATSGTQLINSSNTRTFSFTGTFTPGSNAAFTGLSASSADVLLSFTQVGGPDTAVSVSWTLATPSTSTIPEPSTFALAGFAALGLVVAARRRK